MSAIVVVKKADHVAIAADTCTCFGDTRMLAEYEENLDKIINCRDTFIGISGTPAHKLVLEHLLGKSDKYDFSSRESVFETMLRLHMELKDKYFLNPEEENSEPYESSQFEILIANKFGIFGVYSLREVTEYSRFWAMGSGGNFALGALFSAYPSLNDAEEIAHVGVKAAAEFDTGTATPIRSYVVKLERNRKSRAR